MEDKERTLYCGNLSDKVTEDLLYELFLQAGPLENVIIPKDKEGRKKNFGFITFKHAVSVPYSIALLGGVSLYGRTLRLDPRGESSAYNPYLEQLRNYDNSIPPQSFQSNDNRSRRQDPRRYEPRNDINRFDSMNLPSPRNSMNLHSPMNSMNLPSPMNSMNLPSPMNSQSPMNVPIVYPGHSQQFTGSMNFQQSPTHGVPFPPVANMYPNQWQGYR